MNKESPKVRVVIAEDDDAAAHLIETNLRRTPLECEFSRARNGVDLLELMNGDAPQSSALSGDRVIVLLDIRMPRLDGIQVLRQIKSSGKLKSTPVIMMTTSDRPTEVETCYQLGCNAYIRKQVDYRKFRDSIRALADFITLTEIPVYGDGPNE